jgi:hypothetical protein
MIDLYDNATNVLIGSMTDADLKVLQDALEEESEDDQDYYIDQATLDVLGDGRATDHLMGLLRKALGTAEGVDIRWQRRQLSEGRRSSDSPTASLARAVSPGSVNCVIRSFWED